ncbi:MAG TPA: HAD family phosphatase [Candidatus Limnocylindrales bacterium]|nr:HAD family phosphatase [Candidatus Limnocylindrales bacterium]
MGDRRFEAVLFDMDGVLVDSEPWWNEVRVAFAERLGLSWTHDDQAACMGGNSLEWARIMQARLGLDAVPVEAIRDAVVDGVVERYRANPAPIIGDAPAQVRRIAAAWPVAIASSSHRAIIDAAMEALGLHDVLGVVVSSDEVPLGKPEPDVYRLAASRLGIAPDRCLVVEDSVNGVRAGKAAGMSVVLVPNASVPPGGNARELADAIVGSLADLDPDHLLG